MFILMGFFWAKYLFCQPKKYRGVVFHGTEEGYKIWRGIDLPFQNKHKEFDKIWTEHLKVSKIFILLGSHWAKCIFFELKKNRVIIFHETEEGYKIWRGIAFQNWHKKFHKLWPEHTQISKVFILTGFFWAKYIFCQLKSIEEWSFLKLKRDTNFVVESTRGLEIGIRNLRKFGPSTQKSQKCSF